MHNILEFFPIYNIPKVYVIILMLLLIIALISISYLCGIDLKKFSLNINIQVFFCIVLIFLCYFVPLNFISGTFDKIKYFNVYDKSLIREILNGFKNLIYPAAREEYLFRGLLISGLLYLNMDKWKVNIIQATIFGIVHISTNKSNGLGLTCAILATSAQILMGYLFGKVFFKTNSLLPGIILHMLIDTV